MGPVGAVGRFDVTSESAAIGSLPTHHGDQITLFTAGGTTTERLCTTAYELWTALLSACVFTCLREHDQSLIVELERRSVNRHQAKHFLSGLRKLDLDREPNDVVRCAKYHYFSNTLGGLPMHYVEESPQRVWIRYLAPYWMGDGPTQPSAGPAVLSSAFGRAPYLGWHANNGAYLGNDRLIFVQTQSLCDGDPWDAGYFTLHDRPVGLDDAYQRRIGEWGPPPDPRRTPELPHAAWPKERRLRALRNFAIDFTASRYVTLAELIGPAAAGRIVEQAWTVVLAQRWETLPSAFGLAAVYDAADAAVYVANVAIASGDDIVLDTSGRSPVVEQRRMRLWRDEKSAVPEIDLGIGRAWSRVLQLHRPGLGCTVDPLPDGGYRWEFQDWAHG